MVNNTHNVALLIRTQRLPLRDMVPFFQAAATAGSGSVLSNKHRVTTHRCLFTVVLRLCGRQTPGDKIGRMAIDNLRTFINTVLPLFCAKAEAAAES